MWYCTVHFRYNSVLGSLPHHHHFHQTRASEMKKRTCTRRRPMASGHIVVLVCRKDGRKDRNGPVCGNHHYNLKFIDRYSLLKNKKIVNTFFYSFPRRQKEESDCDVTYI